MNGKKRPPRARTSLTMRENEKEVGDNDKEGNGENDDSTLKHFACRRRRPGKMKSLLTEVEVKGGEYGSSDRQRPPVHLLHSPQTVWQRMKITEMTAGHMLRDRAKTAV